MRALLQRVSESRVRVNGEVVAQSGRGLLIFVGVGRHDTTAQAEILARKVSQLRIFPGAEGRMNHSALDVQAELLIVSQFTLYGDTRKGNRPSYSEAAKPEDAKHLYEYFVAACRRTGLSVQTGVFQAQMSVELTNDGPVTLMCYSEP